MLIIAYIAIGVLIVAGLAVLGRKREISEEEYEAMKGKQSHLGNALQQFQSFFEPGREQLKKAKEERRVEQDGGGEPPEPGERV